jgi:hypothetical protein
VLTDKLFHWLFQSRLHLLLFTRSSSPAPLHPLLSLLDGLFMPPPLCRVGARLLQQEASIHAWKLVVITASRQLNLALKHEVPALQIINPAPPISSLGWPPTPLWTGRRSPNEPLSLLPLPTSRSHQAPRGLQPVNTDRVDLPRLPERPSPAHWASTRQPPAISSIATASLREGFAGAALRLCGPREQRAELPPRWRAAAAAPHLVWSSQLSRRSNTD